MNKDRATEKKPRKRSSETEVKSFRSSELRKLHKASVFGWHSIYSDLYLFISRVVDIVGIEELSIHTSLRTCARTASLFSAKAFGDFKKTSIMSERPVMYLEYDDWSPRYQETFYTVRIESFELLTSLPEAASHLPPNQLGSNNSLPAYYYEIKVFCGRHPPRIVYRRYSQFKWLYENITKLSSAVIGFPSGSSCFFCSPNTESVAKERIDTLKDFLEEALVRREIASSEVVAQFLELDALVSMTKRLK